ncbi:MAG TPA: hypothetical protein VGL66_00730 [Caulobacteraceae bacterium]|jgi:hypothetical protein
MLVRVVCAAALVLAPVAPAYAGGVMPGPSATVSAHCPEMAMVHVDSLPASAWAPVDYPAASEDALRAAAGDSHPIAGPSVHVFRTDASDGRAVSVIAEKTGGAWKLSVADSRGGKAISRKVTLRPDRAHNLDVILADACFWAEPTDLSTQPSDAACPEAIEMHLEALVPQGRRSAAQHCSPSGLTGQVAELLWNGADIE